MFKMIRKTLLVGLLLAAAVAPVQEAKAWGPVSLTVLSVVAGMGILKNCLDSLGGDDNYGEAMIFPVTVFTGFALTLLGCGGYLIHQVGKRLP